MRSQLTLAALAASLIVAGPVRGSIALERPTVLEVDDTSQNLTLVDLDGDGRVDVLAANNAKATIDLFYRLSSEEIAAQGSEDPTPNPYDKEGLITGRVVDGMAVGDLDGNGLADVVVGSERGGAAVFFQTDPRRFETARRLPAPGRFVLVTDWDGDGKPEILAISTVDRPAILTCLRAGADREIKTLWTEALAADVGDTPRLVDWEGDGFVDLLWSTADMTEAHVLHNDGQGGVGGETVIDLGQTLDWAPLQIPKVGMALVTIERASGILRLLAQAPPEPSESPLSFGAPRQVALPEADPSDRVPLVAVRAGSQEAQALYLPSRTMAEAMLASVRPGRLIRRESLPGLRETLSAQELPDGSMLLVSRAEGTVGLTPGGRLGSEPPQPLPITLQPLAAVAGDFDADGNHDLLVIGRGSDPNPVATLITRFQQPQARETQSVTLPDLPTDDPTEMRAADLNGDGREDVVIFYQYRAPAVYVQSGESSWEALSSAVQIPSTFFEGIGPSALWVGDLLGNGEPEVLLARGELVRVVSFAHPPEAEVLAQITAPRPGAAFVGVAGLRGDATHPPAIFALDRTSSTVLVAQPDDQGAWDIAGEVDLQLQSPQRLAIGDWDGDGREDLAVKGANALGLYFGGLTHPPLEQLSSRESPLEKGRLGRVQTLAWDGGPPWVHAVDHRYHALFMWNWLSEKAEWEDICRFKVFETPLEMRDTSEAPPNLSDVQPREMAVGDTDGDGRDDLVLLAFDRLLIYPRKGEGNELAP